MAMADRVARRFGLDPDLVADIALDALLLASQTYDPMGGRTFKSYARTLVIKAYRKYEHEQPTLEDLDKEPIGQKPDSDLNYSRDDWAVLLVDVKSKLTDEEFKILRWHYVDGHSMDLIGQWLGVIRQTVWNRIRKIRRKIE